MKNILIQILEKTLRNVSLKRHLPKKFSNTPLYVSPDAQLKYLKPGSKGFDELLLIIVEQFVSKGDVIWDVGANVGVFSFCAASRGAQVVAVEPDPFLVSLFRNSLQIKENRNLDCKVVPVAISGKIGLELFQISKRGRAANSLASSDGARNQMGGVRQEIIVPVMTLDSLLDFFPAPNFIKIDVEGAEINVMKGAKNILKEVRPFFFIEADSNTRPRITKIFRQHNYALFEDVKSLDPNINADFNLEIEVEGDLNTKDNFCVPREKLELLKKKNVKTNI